MMTDWTSFPGSLILPPLGNEVALQSAVRRLHFTRVGYKCSNHVDKARTNDIESSFTHSLNLNDEFTFCSP